MKGWNCPCYAEKLRVFRDRWVYTRPVSRVVLLNGAGCTEHMLVILILATIAVLVWALLTPSLSFARGFATLVDQPRVMRIAPGFPRAQSMVSGQFKGRAVG